MISAIALALAIPGPVAAITPGVAANVAQDPPIRIWLDKRDAVERGDRVRVRVRAEEDGYLVVLHADPEGRVRVLFPLDPIDDHYMRGGREYEVRSRGDRHAFTVHETSGLGTVYAAYSRDPFQFDGFTRRTHWDYTLDVWRMMEDVEGELTALVGQMALGGRFDYDLAYYDVYDTVAYTRRYRSAYYSRHYYDPFYCDVFYCSPFYLIGDYGFRSGFHIGIGIGFGHRHHYYSPVYYDPFYYDPFYWDPYYYHPYRYGFYRPARYRGYYYPRGTVFLGRRETFVDRRYTFKSPQREFVESVTNRRRPSPSVSSTTTTQGRRSAPSATSPRTRRPSSATTAPTRRTPSDAARRPNTSEGRRSPAKTPRGRVTTPGAANRGSSSPREATSRREIDQRSRAGVRVIEQREDDSRGGRHYIVRIRGSRAAADRAEGASRAERRSSPSVSRERASTPRTTARSLRPRESGNRALRSTPRSESRSGRVAAPKRSSVNRSAAPRSRVRSATPRVTRPSPAVRSAPRRSSPRVRSSRPSVRSSRPSVRSSPGRVRSPRRRN